MSGMNPPGPSTIGAYPWQKYPGWTAQGTNTQQKNVWVVEIVSSLSGLSFSINDTSCIFMKAAC
jgi:hypothetical protein